MPSLIEIEVVLENLFFKVVNVFFLCGYYLPLKKCMALNLNKFEFPLPKNTLCRFWLELAQRFRRRFSKFDNIFFNFWLLSPLRKRAKPSFDRNWIPLTQGCVPSLVEIGPVVQENKSSMYFAWPFIWTNLNHLHLECFMSSMMELKSVILNKLIFVKIWMDTWTDRQTDRQIDRK